MRITLALTCLLFTATVQANPVQGGDELDRFLSDKGLIDQVSPTPPPQSGFNKTSELVVAAMGSLGVPYRRGGNTFEGGYDCSGFVRAIYEQTAGLLLPRLAAQQAASTQPIDRNELQPGDLVFFNTMQREFSHVGIYVGDFKFIHSPKPGAAVRIEDMRVNYWNRRFDGARRAIMQTTAGFAAPASPSGQTPATGKF